MRKIYITVIALFVMSVLLFISSFAYLDRTKRHTYYYIVNVDGRDIGQIKIDRYDTEDKSVYKSVKDAPFGGDYTQSRYAITFDKRLGLENYEKEQYLNGETDVCYIEAENNLASFMSVLGPDFLLSSDISIKKDTSVFEQDALLTYLPLIERYNFQTGAFQGFDALIIFSRKLPPMRKFVSLTFVKNDYIKIPGGSSPKKYSPRKIRTENLSLKIRGLPQSLIWVAKSDKSIIKIEIPDHNIKMTRIFYPKPLDAKPWLIKPGGYVSREVSYKSKNVQLSGTLTVPEKDGKYPAVLLVGGNDAYDREACGLFSNIADYLSRNGFCVLRFDKRGIGQSAGNRPQSALSDIVEDIDAGIEYMTSQKEVDPTRVALLGWGEGAYYAIKAASKNGAVRSLVLMAPLVYGEAFSSIWQEEVTQSARSNKWSDEYLKLVIRSAEETRKKSEIDKNTFSYLRRKCHLKDMKERQAEKPMEVIAAVKVPVLILQGKEADDESLRLAPIIDKTIAENGNTGHMLTYYGYLGGFFGKKVSDGIHEIRYETDKEVLENIKNWLDSTVVIARQ